MPPALGRVRACGASGREQRTPRGRRGRWLRAAGVRPKAAPVRSGRPELRHQGSGNRRRMALRVEAAAAIERDGPNPSELRTRRCAPARPGCAPTTETPMPRRARPKRNGRDRTMANGTKITMASARPFTTADGREAVLWDSVAPELGLRARPNGRTTWIGRRRRNGSVVRRTLGPLDALTVEDARVAARALLADCAERWKPATRKTYAFNMRRWIEPAFGDCRVDVIVTKDVRSRSTPSRPRIPPRRAGRWRRCRHPSRGRRQSHPAGAAVGRPRGAAERHGALVAGRALEGTGRGRARCSARRRSSSASATTRWRRSRRLATSRPSSPTSRRPTAASWRCGRTVPAARRWRG